MCFHFNCLSSYKCDKFKDEGFSVCVTCLANGDCDECEHSENRGDGVLICTWFADKLAGE